LFKPFGNLLIKDFWTVFVLEESFPKELLLCLLPAYKSELEVGTCEVLRRLLNFASACEKRQLLSIERLLPMLPSLFIIRMFEVSKLFLLEFASE